MKHTVQFVRLPTGVLVASIASHGQRLEKVFARTSRVEAPPACAFIAKATVHARVKSRHVPQKFFQQLANSSVEPEKTV